MTKRMMIMLVAVAVVLGGIFGFQAFKGEHDQEIHERAGLSPPQTVSTTKAALQAMAAEHRGGRQPARGQRRRSVA